MSTKISQPTVAYRFDCRDRIEKFVYHGAVWFGHARLYANEELPRAQRDEEQVRKHSLKPRDGRIVFTPPSQSPIEVAGVLEVRLNVKLPDYYMLCLTTTYDRQFYDEFQCDACVEIRDFPEFYARLNKGVASAMHGWVLYGRAVEYFEGDLAPVHKDEPMRLVFSKRARIPSQNEYRLILWNEAHPSAEDGIILTMGSLADICRIVYR